MNDGTLFTFSVYPTLIISNNSNIKPVDIQYVLHCDMAAMVNLIAAFCKLYMVEMERRGDGACYSYCVVYGI